MQLTDRPGVRAELVVAAPADEVWPFVSDPLLLPAWSEELQSVEWLDDAHFRGHNENAFLGSWSTVCTVIESVRPRAFAWAVEDPAAPIAVWRFDLFPAMGGGTLLRQSATLGPGESGLTVAVATRPDRADRIVAARMAQWQAAVERTVAGVKQRAEAARRSG